jgi:hypothetical protein
MPMVMSKRALRRWNPARARRAIRELYGTSQTARPPPHPDLDPTLDRRPAPIVNVKLGAEWCRPLLLGWDGRTAN